MNRMIKSKTLAFAVLGLAMMVFIAATNAVKHRVFTIGDSTVQDYNSGWAPRKGWGQMLPFFFNSGDVQVINRAVGGTSSRSFYNSFWADVKKEMTSGDYLFIQFGINDRASDAARRAMGADFKGFLKNYVNEARTMGVIPVLVSTVRRSAFNGDGTAYDAYHEHPTLVREVAAELNVPLIDLDAKNKAGMEAATERYVARNWYNNYLPGEYPSYGNGNNDNVHFQEMGALQLAKYVVEGIQQLSGNAQVSKLIPYIKPQYTVTVKQNYTNAGLVTRTEKYPAGVNIHLKAMVNSGHRFINWKDVNGNLYKTDSLVQFTMPANNLTYTAYFDNEIPMNLDCQGVVNGKAIEDACGICTGGTTGKVPCTSSVQAEEACSIDGVMNESTNEGFRGTGYANTDNDVDKKILLSVFSDKDQSIPVYFRFANGGAASRSMSLLLNGQNAGDLTFNATGSFATWAVESKTLSLKKGNNLLELSALSASGGPNLDLLAFDVQGINKGICGIDCQGVFAGIAYVDSCGTCVSGTTGLEACTQDCEGNWGGVAFEDSCGQCVQNISAACVGFIQGEEACMIDGVMNESTNGGYKGTGYANTNNVIGSSVSWFLSSDIDKTQTLKFRFANGGATDRNGVLYINGQEVGVIGFSPSGAWNWWSFSSIDVPFMKGSNELMIVSQTADGLGNIDLLVLPKGVMGQDCFVTGTEEMSSSIKIYPNPTSGLVYLPEMQNWVLLSSTLIVLEQGGGSQIDLSKYKTGLYFIEIKGQIHSIIKQ